METNVEAKPVPCDGWCDANEATMIGDKGYAYCAECGPKRRQSGYERVRKMTPAELRTIQSGHCLAKY